MEPVLIRVNHLGKIKSTEVEVSPFVIFSGESGLGKSYLAMLSHFIFHILLDQNGFNKFYKGKGYDYTTLSESFNESGVIFQIQRAELEFWLADEAIQYLRYMLGNDSLTGDISIILPHSIPDELIMKYRKEVSGLEGLEQENIILSFGELTYRVREEADFDESPFAFITRYALIDYLFDDFKSLKNEFVMPPSRGPMLTEKITCVTGLYQEYSKGLDMLNKASMRTDDESHKAIELLHSILEGEVTRVESKYYYKMKESMESDPIPLSSAAASIREIAPLQFLVQKTDVSKVSVLIEEPEAHLHPSKQRMMADIICCLSHSGTFLQITTHSDYFLRRFNEIFLFSLIKSKQTNKKKIDTLSKKLLLCPEINISSGIIKAYLMQKREDGSSFAKLQGMDDGIPFESFLNALKDSVNNQDLIEDFLSDVD